MKEMIYIFAAFAFIWAGVLAYVMRLSGLRRRLEERIDLLQERLDRREEVT